MHSGETSGKNSIRAWLRPGVIDAFAACLFLSIMAGYPEYMFDDPGTGWHLRTGQYILDNHQFPRTDPFLSGAEGREWIANQWLPEVIGAWWHGRAGWIGLRFVTAIVLTLTYSLLYRFLVEADVEPAVAVVLCIWAVLGSAFHFLARPTVVSVLFVGLTYRQLWLYFQGKRSARQLLWLVPAFAVWANCHGGVLAGHVMIALAVAAVLIRMAADEPRNAPGHLGRAWPLVLLAIACFAATLVNPYGFRLYTWSYKLLSMSWIYKFNEEFKTFDFHAPGAMRIELAILLLFVLAAIARRRLGAFETAVTVFWLHQGIQTTRFLVMLLWVAMLPIGQCIMAFPWSGWVKASDRPADGGSLLDRLARRERQVRPGGLIAACVMAAVGAILLIPATRGFVESAGLNKIEPSRAMFPYGSLEHIRATPPGTRVFHNLNWGGFLTLHLWPEHKAYIDDRNELCGEAAYNEYFEVYYGAADWRAFMDEHGFGLVLIGARAPLRYLMEQDPQWRLVYEDKPQPDTDDGRTVGEVLLRRVPGTTAGSRPATTRSKEH